MTYKELKEMARIDAIKAVLPPDFELADEHLASFPLNPDVIIFGGNYWKSNEGIAEFIEKYVNPQSEKDIQNFFNEFVYRIVEDPHLCIDSNRKMMNVAYTLLYKQYYSLFSNPTKVSDYAEASGTFFWFDSILKKRREIQFQKIKKAQDDAALAEISAKIKAVYNFKEAEMIYLRYFCSQTKLDDFDASLNTFIYLWSKEKGTGKTTVGELICSFLNGEEKKNADPHKSKLKIEMQFDRFAIPKSTTSRCTLIDEGGFSDMEKSYDNFKQTITSNSCEVEYKYKIGHRERRCYRNYLFTSNTRPEFFVQDEDERRMLSIHFKKPKKLTSDELFEMWYTFVFECNLPAEKLETIYWGFIQPNSQVGELKNIMTELIDIFTRQRIDACSRTSYFSVSNVMSFPEIRDQKKISRKVVKDVLTILYGQPDKNQRFYKLNRNTKYDTIEQAVEDVEVVPADVFYKEPEGLPF